MLHKFALAFKTKTIEFFAEEDEDEDADGFAPSPARADGVLAGQRVVVLKPDPLLKVNPNPSGDGGEAVSGEEAAVAAALATVSSFQAAYLHLQAAHAPFLPEAAAAADAAAVSHLRRLSELKRLARGPAAEGSSSPTTSLTAHLEAQVRENQALLRSFDAVVNRLQAALDAKDAAATALRRGHEALEADNARLAARLDRALAPPPPPAGAVGAMLSAGVFDSVLRDALRVAHRFAARVEHALPVRPPPHVLRLRAPGSSASARRASSSASALRSAELLRRVAASGADPCPALRKLATGRGLRGPFLSTAAADL